MLNRPFIEIRATVHRDEYGDWIATLHGSRLHYFHQRGKVSAATILREFYDQWPVQSENIADVLPQMRKRNAKLLPRCL
ncbi:hypothetical protein MAIT1_00766 [Magnetofaba australis IT-1]|uniref:Uncharacterized protein n=1 Tax=Magnetofaba australis IT-1 TaxID=1434232 RepID=A0A1Y2K0L2_9PROT|nr:hypothetical protein MAIT1_00766 [Magnetofaba australis IT-1]